MKAKRQWEIELQRQVFDLKKTTGQPLGRCYEAIAKEKGFKTYAAFRQAMISAGIP